VTTWQDEGLMMDFVSSGDAVNDHWFIYSNLWHDPMPPATYPRFLESQYRPQTNIFVYNNAFVGLWSGIGAGNGGSWASSCASSNNIYFPETVDNAGVIEFGNGSDDYNLGSLPGLAGSHSISSASTAIFTDFSAGTYSIVPTIGAGYPHAAGKVVNPIAGVTATDYAGNAWANPPSIGAYEYVGASPDAGMPPDAGASALDATTLPPDAAAPVDAALAADASVPPDATAAPDAAALIPLDAAAANRADAASQSDAATAVADAAASRLDASSTDFGVDGGLSTYTSGCGCTAGSGGASVAIALALLCVPLLRKRPRRLVSRPVVGEHGD